MHGRLTEAAHNRAFSVCSGHTPLHKSSASSTSLIFRKQSKCRDTLMNAFRHLPRDTGCSEMERTVHPSGGLVDRPSSPDKVSLHKSLSKLPLLLVLPVWSGHLGRFRVSLADIPLALPDDLARCLIDDLEVRTCWIRIRGESHALSRDIPAFGSLEAVVTYRQNRWPRGVRMKELVTRDTCC